ncbi:MAG: phasin family protein [Alphaproteobacteria bacterium]|nr:phasin family protein [Alphaproteobacteria bacterium]
MSEVKFGDQATVDQSTNAAETIARASSDVVRETSERAIEQAREGSRRAAAASTAGAEAAMRTGSSLAEGMQDITRAWARYAEEVMRQTSEASRALIGCQSLSEIFEIQSRLLRGNMQAFLDQSSEMAEIAGRMATRPLQALKQAGEAQSAR